MQALNTKSMDSRMKFARLKYASVWESVGLNRLSLYDIANNNTREAMNVAKESQNIRIELKRFTRDCHRQILFHWDQMVWSI